MRIIFNQLSAIKKESKSLRKAIKNNNHPAWDSRLPSELSLSNVQNIVAKSYGWQNYNDMESIHNYLRDNGGYSNFISERGEIKDPSNSLLQGLRLVESLTDDERSVLHSSKKRLIVNWLYGLGLPSDNVEDIILEGLRDKGSWTSRLLSLPQRDVTHLHQLRGDEWRTHVRICGGSEEQKKRLFTGEVLSHALCRGGLFLLTEATAKSTISDIQSQCESAGKQLLIIDKEGVLPESITNYVVVSSGDVVESKFVESLLEHSLIVCVLPDRKRDEVGRYFLTLFRKYLVPQLGARIDVGQSELIKKDHSNRVFAKPILLESYQDYVMPGMAIIAAQARGLSCSVMFHFDEGALEKSLAGPSRVEFESTIANTLNGIYFSLESMLDCPGFRLSDRANIFSARQIMDSLSAPLKRSELLLAIHNRNTLTRVCY